MTKMKNHQNKIIKKRSSKIGFRFFYDEKLDVWTDKIFA